MIYILCCLKPLLACGQELSFLSTNDARPHVKSIEDVIGPIQGLQFGILDPKSIEQISVAIVQQGQTTVGPGTLLKNLRS